MIPLIKRGCADKIANVRFVAAKTVKQLLSQSHFKGKQDVLKKYLLTEFQTLTAKGEDEDVK